MAKKDGDPVLRELIRSVNESDQSAVPFPLTIPVTLTVRGAVLQGSLIAAGRYFAELVQASPLMNALDPDAGLLDDDYAKDVTAESGRYLHLRAADAASGDSEATDLWRIGLDAVDAWTLHASADPTGQQDNGAGAANPVDADDQLRAGR
jgi:hypothetical protein